MKILFLGSSRFSEIVMQKMLDLNLNIVACITQPDRPSGRGHKLQATEVKKLALEKGIDVYTFERIKPNLDTIKAIDYDVAVVASFGQILPQDFLSIKLTINVHPSLLPKYRGATPIQNAILNGDEMTGVTIMKVAKEVDAGDIILQKQMPIKDEYYNALEEKLALLGGEMVYDVIKQIEEKTIKFTPQDHSKATLVSKFNKENGKLQFDKTAKQIVNQVRALAEELGCYINIDDRTIKVAKVQDVSSQFSVMQNKILENKKNFVIGCKDGAIEVLQCQAPSGKMISGRDFINGHNNILGKSVSN